MSYNYDVLITIASRGKFLVQKNGFPGNVAFFPGLIEYKCHCDSRYVGRTCQRLLEHFKQHVLQWLRQQSTRPRRSQPHRLCKRNDTKRDCDSAIGQHLLDNYQCALNYDNKRFSILAAARSSAS